MNQNGQFCTVPVGMAGIFRTGIPTGIRNTPKMYRKIFRLVPAGLWCFGRRNQFRPIHNLFLAFSSSSCSSIIHALFFSLILVLLSIVHFHHGWCVCWIGLSSSSSASVSSTARSSFFFFFGFSYFTTHLIMSTYHTHPPFSQSKLTISRYLLSKTCSVFSPKVVFSFWSIACSDDGLYLLSGLRSHAILFSLTFSKPFSLFTF